MTLTRENIVKLSIYILLITSVDTVLFGTNDNQLFLYIPRIIGLLVLILIPLITRNVTIRLNSLFNINLLLLLIETASNLKYNVPLPTAISHYISILVAYVIVEYYDHFNFCEIFDNFIYFISIIAIIVEVLSFIVPPIFRAMPTIYNTAGDSVHIFLIGSIRDNTIGTILFRSTSIFWEPGAYAIYLFFGIMNQLFLLDKTSVKRLIVLSISLIITFSTTGYIATSFLILAYAFSNRNRLHSKKIKRLIVLGTISFVLFISLVENSTIFSRVFGKLTGETETSSAMTRFSSLINGMRISIDHPLLGISPINMRSFMGDYAETSFLNISDSYTINANTFAYHFASYGLIFGLIFIFGYFLYTRKLGLNIYSWFLLFLSILLAFSGETFYSFMPFIFMSYGYKKGLLM